MTCRDRLCCIHEPFGDAFYFGPERLSERYRDDKQARLESGFSQSTYQDILDRIDNEATEVGLIPPNTLVSSCPLALVFVHLFAFRVVFILRCLAALSFLCMHSRIKRDDRLILPFSSITVCLSLPF